MNARFLLGLTAFVACHWQVSLQLGAQQTVDYARDIRPILSDRCFVCHGPDANQRAADLRLDESESAYDLAIEPGDPESSELVRRIITDDTDELMPPPDSKLELNDAEKALLIRWVEEGAAYDTHWAFQAVGAQEFSSSELNGFNSPIDLFVSEQLSQRGLHASKRADKATLIRRLSFDITGLPPTIEETQAFLSDDAEGSYERLVDRLLASERFGERMAVDWLDVARYADTYGYQNDRYRPMWPWRDWVVRAFNENLPYDQFITWQLAGDLLSGATKEQILATAFNRNHRQTNEGGSVEEEFRAEYVADRVNTFGAAFLGLTLECSRCHDHKYDPISQREYYQLAAFFNSIDESGLYSHFTEATPTPTLQLTDSDQAMQLTELRQQINTEQRSLQELTLKEERYQEWRKSLNDVRPLPGESSGNTSLLEQLKRGVEASLIGDYPLDEVMDGKLANRADDNAQGKTSENPQLVDGRVGKGLQLSGENNATFETGGDFTRNQRFSVALWVQAPQKFDRAVIFHRSRAWTDSGSRGYELLIEDGKLSAALIHFWPGNALRVISQEELPIGRWTHVGIVYDGSSSARGLQIFVDGQAVETTVVKDKLTKHIKGADGFGGGDSSELAIGQRFRDRGFKYGKVDELRVFDSALSALEMRVLYSLDAFPDNVPEIVYNLSEDILRDYFLRSQEEYASQLDTLKKLRDEFSALNDTIPEIMVMRELSQPRPSFVLARGAYDAPGEQVTRGVPINILSREFSSQADRRDLAAWLVDPQHPLTSRVVVNRIWQMLFGRGLVSTPEDFGLQGSPPSHPRLLDWLAHEFMSTGWNIKQLVKTIVMSATYQQSSDLTAELLDIDPENIFLARGPAVRLPAEMIRDAALYAGGLLVEKRGGPPAKPYQPAGLWKEKSGKVYQRDVGEGSHRRSLYTYWKRTSPPPSMMALDANNREVCAVKRQNTLTPMQMLVLLNDPQYVEAARGLAQQVLKSDASIEDQIEHLFRVLVTRQPDERELEVLVGLFNDQLSIFKDSPDECRQLLQIGDLDVDPNLDSVQLAALTVVAEGLMTFDETVMKR